MTQALIVTSETDLHADVVIEKLNSSRVKPIRLNTETFIKQSQYCFSWDANGELQQQSLFFADSLRSAKDVKVIWWRKPRHYNIAPEVTDLNAHKYCLDETKSLIQSLPGLFPHASWVNNLYALKLPARRINQIPIAKELGITIPPTIVTNQYEQLVDFVSFYKDCIIKPMDFSGFLHENVQYACYTSQINLKTIENFKNSIHLAPVFVQKRIRKKAEYRVTLIGEKSFVCRIETNHLNDDQVDQDWRIIEPDKLVHKIDILPEEFIRKLHLILDNLKLNFGAFDIILGEDDCLYFIELNPNGQWYWIELLTGLPMVNAMVDLIENLAFKEIYSIT